jgi:hypothetical protein
MAAIKEELLVLGMRQVAVKYGKLPLRDSKLPLRVAAALAWRGALSSSPSLILLNSINNIILSTNRSYVILPCITNTF